MPTAASTSATTAKTPSSSVLKRCRAIDVESTSSIVLMSETGWSLSTSQTVLRTAAARSDGSPSVFMTSWRGTNHWNWTYGRYICSLGSAVSSNCRTSFTTPTTSIQGEGESGGP